MYSNLGDLAWERPLVANLSNLALEQALVANLGNVAMECSLVANLDSLVQMSHLGLIMLKVLKTKMFRLKI